MAIRRVKRITVLWARFRPSLSAAISRFRDHFRCRVAALPRAGWRAGIDRHRGRYAGRRAHRQERAPSVGRLAAAIGIRPLAGYEDVNDADRLCRDPAMRWVVGDRAISGSAASASQVGRFETKWLSRPENLAGLADLPGQWLDKVHRRRPPKTIVLEMDSSENPTYGEQEGSAYNGPLGCTCYHPLFVFNQFGNSAMSSDAP